MESPQKVAKQGDWSSKTLALRMEEHLKSVTATDLFKDHCRESVFPCSVGLEKMTPVLAIGTHEVRKPRTKLEL